jgi:hypothetical protein
VPIATASVIQSTANLWLAELVIIATCAGTIIRHRFRVCGSAVDAATMPRAADEEELTMPPRICRFPSGLAALVLRHLCGASFPAFQPTLTPERYGGRVFTLLLWLLRFIWGHERRVRSFLGSLLFHAGIIGTAR